MTASFEILVRHLGLEEAFFGGPKFSRTMKGATVRLSEDALVARNDAVGEGYVVGEDLLSILLWVSTVWLCVK